MGYELFDDITKSIPDIPDESIVSKSIIKKTNQKVILFGFASGQELTDHTSSLNAIIHVVKGSAEIIIGKDSISAGPDTWIHLPPEIPHSVTALTELYMLLYLFPEK